MVLHPSGGGVIAAIVLLPLSAAAAGAVHIAVDRQLGDSPSPTRRVVAWLIPALTLGLAARALEDDVAARHRRADIAAACDLAPLVIEGAAAPRSLLAVDDTTTLVRWSRDRVVFALRPDTTVLPLQSLLLGGPGRMASHAIEAIPQAADVVRGLLARGALEEFDVSPVEQRVPLRVDLAVPRFRALARHGDATGGPIHLALERVDPSDRRLRRNALERRLRFVIDALRSAPEGEPVRANLRRSATREARLLSTVDRDASEWALARALALGADPARITRWTVRLRSKQSLEAEPACEDD